MLSKVISNKTKSDGTPKGELAQSFAAVIDLFSRRVIGWLLSAAMTAQFVTNALVMAIWRRGKADALLHHSDRGSQYTSSSNGGFRGLHRLHSRYGPLEVPKLTRPMLAQPVCHHDGEKHRFDRNSPVTGLHEISRARKRLNT